MPLLFIMIMFFSGAHAENLSTKAFYSNFLYAEKASNSVHMNFEGFIGNVKKGTDIKDVKGLVGCIHNILHDTFYSCKSDAPKAKTFTEAVDGKHTPDSQHYASLIHSALAVKGIRTDFFKTPTHYGVHYMDEDTGKEFFWCIITPLAMKSAPETVEDYVAVFNKFKNPKINGKETLSASDVTIISADEFEKLNSI